MHSVQFARWSLLIAIATLFVRDRAIVEQAFAQVSEPAFDCKAAIDGLASKNNAPTIPGRLASTNSVRFPRNYDFKDQERVRKHFAKLANDPSEELWECLLAHRDDKRYAFTMGYNSHLRRNYTVQSLCNWISSEQLMFVTRKYSQPDFDGRPKYLDVSIDDLLKWREERAGKKLWELQLEMIELARQTAMKEESLDQKARELMFQEMDADIRKLRKEKTRFHFKIGMDALEFITPENAMYQEK